MRAKQGEGVKRSEAKSQAIASFDWCFVVRSPRGFVSVLEGVLPHATSYSTYALHTVGTWTWVLYCWVVCEIHVEYVETRCALITRRSIVTYDGREKRPEGQVRR